MSQYCNQCQRPLSFLCYKYREQSNDGSQIVLCRDCRKDMVEKIRAEFRPLQLSEGYTRIKATLFLQMWKIPTLCVICASQEGLRSQKLLSLHNGAVTISIPIYSCRRCSKCGLDPSKHIRYELTSNNLTLDVGNPAVAEKYAAFLTTELSTLKRALQDKTIEFDIGGSRIP